MLGQTTIMKKELNVTCPLQTTTMNTSVRWVCKTDMLQLIKLLLKQTSVVKAHMLSFKTDLAFNNI